MQNALMVAAMQGFVLKPVTEYPPYLAKMKV
jgi:hypothetical protein